LSGHGTPIIEFGHQRDIAALCGRVNWLQHNRLPAVFAGMQVALMPSAVVDVVLQSRS